MLSKKEISDIARETLDDFGINVPIAETRRRGVLAQIAEKIRVSSTGVSISPIKLYLNYDLIREHIRDEDMFRRLVLHELAHHLVHKRLADKVNKAIERAIRNGYTPSRREVYELLRELMRTYEYRAHGSLFKEIAEELGAFTGRALLDERSKPAPEHPEEGLLRDPETGKPYARVAGWETPRSKGRFIVPARRITEISQVPKSAKYVDIVIFDPKGRPKGHKLIKPSELDNYILTP